MIWRLPILFCFALAVSARAQDVYFVPRQEGLISRLFRMQQESDAAERQAQYQREQMRLMEAQRKLLEAQTRALGAINGDCARSPCNPAK